MMADPIDRNPPRPLTALGRAVLFAIATFLPILQLAAAGLDRLPAIVEAPALVQLRDQLADLSRREADLSATYGSAYPALAQVRAERVRVDRAIKAEIERLTPAQRTKRAAHLGAVGPADADERPLDVSDADAEPQAAPIETTPVPPPDLQAPVARAPVAQTPVAQAPVAQAPAAQDPAARDPVARVASDPAPAETETDTRTVAAAPPLAQVSPLAGVVIGLLFGICLGLLVAQVLSAVLAVRRRRGPEAPLPAGSPAAANGNAFILGRVPAVGQRGRPIDLGAYLEARPDSDFARSLDDLVTKLAAGGRIVALCPLSPGEGATSLAICLAQAAGMAGKRVLLIDADAGDPKLSNAMEAAGRPGLAEVVGGTLSASKAVMRRQHFALLPVGAEPLSLAKATKPLRAFLAETRTRFDFVLIDTPAFDADPDAMALATLADRFALVASWDRLMRDPFVAAIDSAADKPGFAGIILNRMRAADADEHAVAS